MPDLDESYITSLRGAITELYDGTADLYAIHGDQPTPDSLADKEIRESPRPESIITACSIATQLIEYSGEHLAAFVKILTEPIEPLATWTCVRSMLESCALSAWMSDPSIDHKERIARAFAHRYEGLEQQLKYGRVVLVQPTELDALEQRIDAVEQTAIALGYPRIHNSKGKRMGIGQRMPGATEIIKLVLDEEEMYRLLSAVAHGHSWAIMQLGFKPVNVAADAADIAGIGVKCFEKQVFVNGMAYLGLGAAKAFAKALWHLWSYMGWDRASLTVLLDSVFDQLQAKACARFWRSTTDTA
jgi:hypothetical protein